MKIKQVEELVGITSKNIRFYENQGLLTPERAENGYREYHQKNIDTLKKIKLLRKLGVSVEEIKSILEETESLSACLERQVENLKRERENLTNMQKLADAILLQNPVIETLKTDDWLEEIEKLEKEGVDFVDVNRVDIHRRKKLGALIGGAVMMAMMAGIIALMLWANSEAPMPAYVLAMFIGIPAVAIVGIAVVLRSRLKEIEGGEEDEAAKY